MGSLIHRQDKIHISFFLEYFSWKDSYPFSRKKRLFIAIWSEETSKLKPKSLL